MLGTYILEKRKAVYEPNSIKWAQWFETANRVVKKTEVANGIEISTVFLGLDHQFGQCDPLLFETMIFGGERDGETYRWSVWDEALRGHEQIVAEFSQRCAHCERLRAQDETQCPSCGGVIYK